MRTYDATLEGVAVAEMACPRDEFAMCSYTSFTLISTVSNWIFPCAFDMFKYLFLVQNAWHLPAARYFVPQQSNQNVSVVYSYATALRLGFPLT